MNPPLEKESAADVLVRMAASARTFRSADGRYYASVPVDGHFECHELESAGFRRWLTRLGRAAGHRLPSPATLSSAIGALKAHAALESATEAIYIRVGRNANGSSAYLDLGDPGRHAVEIRADGWEIVTSPGVHFRRAAGQLALPMPERNGSIELLRKYINVDAADFPLLIGCLTAAYRPVGPFPILVVTGEQESAKSTLALVLRLLIDPHDAPLRALPKNEHDLMIAARNNWTLVLNNISSLPDWLSDALCRLSTGAGFSTRSLYSNDEEVLFSAQRPIILNGIDDFVRRADLGDRAVYQHLRPIVVEVRRREHDFWGEFMHDYPRILGGMLDAVSVGLRIWPDLRLPELPRMADFASWGEAVARGLGWQPGTFLAAYHANRKSASLRALEDSPVGSLILDMIRFISPWRGTASDLLAYLELLVRENPAPGRSVPKSPFALSFALRRLAPQLRMAGITVTFDRGKVRRTITIRRTPETGRLATSMESSESVPAPFDEAEPTTASRDDLVTRW